MANQRQKKLAREIFNNIALDKPKNAKELLVSSGYSPSSATASPKVIMEGKGVQQELKELGFSVENAKRIVGAIINTDTVYEMVTPDNQLRAADMIFKAVSGGYEKEKPQENKTLVINITESFAKRYGIPTPRDTGTSSE